MKYNLSKGTVNAIDKTQSQLLWTEHPHVQVTQTKVSHPIYHSIDMC